MRRAYDWLIDLHYDLTPAVLLLIAIVLLAHGLGVLR